MIENDVTPPTLSEEAESWFVRNIRWLTLLTLVAVGILLYIMLPRTMSGELIHILRVMIIMIAASLPGMIYFFFRQRRRIVFDQYRQNLRRLGFQYSAKLYKDKFDTIYGPDSIADSGILLQSPVFIATIMTFVGWLLVFYPLPPEFVDQINPIASPPVYAFLGAYVLGLGTLIRQYTTDDVQLRYFASLIYRYLIVMILAWTLGFLITGNDGENPQTLVLAGSFFIGMFPDIGLRVARRVGERVLRVATRGEEKFPLGKLEGLNAFTEDRLLLEGVESMQNLISSDLVDLMLKTRYPVEQIIDWLDQALLHIHAGDRMAAFSANGIRTATDFLDTYEATDRAASLAEQQRTALAVLVSKTTGGAVETDAATMRTRLDMMSSALSRDPNIFHVRHWRDNEYDALPEDIERKRASADLKLMQGLPDEAIEFYNEVMNDFGERPDTFLYRGLAHFANGDHRRAIADYDAAIEKAGDVPWANARHAYVERGRARRELKDNAGAIADYTEAMETFDDFPEARLALAQVQLIEGEHASAVEQLEQALEQGSKPAPTLATLGYARYLLWSQSADSASDLSPLDNAIDELKQAKQLEPDLIATYINLAQLLSAKAQQSDAIQTLSDALGRIDKSADSDNAYLLHLQRGNLHLGAENYARAAADYHAATHILPNDAAAYFNLGVAHMRAGDFSNAQRALDIAVDLNPQHTVAHEERGDVALALGQFDNAEAAYGTALQLERSSTSSDREAVIHLKLGRLYKQLNRPDDAERELKQAREQASEEGLTFAESSYALGLLYVAQDRTTAAIPLLAFSAVDFEISGAIRQAAEAHVQLAQAHLTVEPPSQAEAKQALEKAQTLLGNVFVPGNETDQRLQTAIQAGMTLV